MTVEKERPAQDVRVAAELAMPESVADDGDQPILAAAALVILGVKVRPICVVTPSTSKKSPSTHMPIDRAQLAAGVQVECALPVASKPPKKSWWSRRYSHCG